MPMPTPTTSTQYQLTVMGKRTSLPMTSASTYGIWLFLTKVLVSPSLHLSCLVKKRTEPQSVKTLDLCENVFDTSQTLYTDKSIAAVYLQDPTQDELHEMMAD